MLMRLTTKEGGNILSAVQKNKKDINPGFWILTV